VAAPRAQHVDTDTGAHVECRSERAHPQTVQPQPLRLWHAIGSVGPRHYARARRGAHILEPGTESWAGTKYAESGLAAFADAAAANHDHPVPRDA